MSDRPVLSGRQGRRRWWRSPEHDDLHRAAHAVFVAVSVHGRDADRAVADGVVLGSLQAEEPSRDGAGDWEPHLVARSRRVIWLHVDSRAPRCRIRVVDEGWSGGKNTEAPPGDGESRAAVDGFRGRHRRGIAVAPVALRISRRGRQRAEPPP